MKKNSFIFTNAAGTARAVCLGVLLSAAANGASAAQSTNDTFGIYGGFGVARRDVRDYDDGGLAKSWGRAGMVALEVPSGLQSSYVVGASASRFSARFIVPTPVDRIGSPARLARMPTPSAISADWSPADGENDFTGYSVTLGAKRYLIPSLGRSGLYLEGDVGAIAMLHTSGRTAVRPTFDAAAGYLWQATKHVGVYAESRVNWFALAIAGEGKSPTWIIAPFQAGASLRR